MIVSKLRFVLFLRVSVGVVKYQASIFFAGTPTIHMYFYVYLHYAICIYGRCKELHC